MIIMNLNEAKNIYNVLNQFYNQQVGIYKQLNDLKQNKEDELRKIKDNINKIQFKKEIIKEASKEARKNASHILEEMATNALQSILNMDKRVEVVLNEDGNTPSAEILVFEKDEFGNEIDVDVTEEDGGGIADIVSLAMFVSMIALAGNKNSAPLILDEPTKYVSKGYSENVSKFLYEISRYLNKQIFMVTHDETLANTADSAYLVERKNLTSEITKIK